MSEIAKELALPLGTVKSHVHRARMKMRTCLERLHQDAGR